MKYETLIWITLGLLTIIGSITFIVIQRRENRKIINENTGKWILNWIYALLIILFVPKIIVNSSYSLHSDKKEWKEYNIPQIDSTMYLSDLSRNRKTYYSYSKDSILHFSKRIEFDLFTTDRIIDEFLNRKKELRLQMTFTKGNLFRKEKRVNLLIMRRGCDDVVIDSLNESRKDSVLKAWGFDSKLYKPDNRYL